MFSSGKFSLLLIYPRQVAVKVAFSVCDYLVCPSVPRKLIISSVKHRLPKKFQYFSVILTSPASFKVDPIYFFSLGVNSCFRHWLGHLLFILVCHNTCKSRPINTYGFRRPLYPSFFQSADLLLIFVPPY